MHWDKPILTDSGGYQVMSLAKLRRIDEEGVTFQSHIDGAKVALTPERAIEVQCLLGADIQMVLDECTPFPGDARRGGDLARPVAALGRAVEACLRGRWRKPGQALFGIVQGSVYPDLRERSARALIETRLRRLRHRRACGRRRPGRHARHGRGHHRRSCRKTGRAI